MKKFYSDNKPKSDLTLITGNPKETVNAAPVFVQVYMYLYIYFTSYDLNV